MLIKPDDAQGRAEALKLALDVFMQYEAPEYSEEGVKAFTRFIEDAHHHSNLTMYGAYAADKIVGVIATRNEGKHISLFFVDGRYHRQGIGKALFHEALQYCPGDTMTVNSSPYAVEAYRHLGFVATDGEQLVDGIRFTPMQYNR